MLKILFWFGMSFFVRTIDAQSHLYMDSCFNNIDPFVDVHFDKNHYQQNDTIFFKIYLVNEGLGHNINSKMVYVDWFGDGRLLDHQFFKMDFKSAKGSFKISNNDKINRLKRPFLHIDGDVFLFDNINQHDIFAPYLQLFLF